MISLVGQNFNDDKKKKIGKQSALKSPTSELNKEGL